MLAFALFSLLPLLTTLPLGQAATADEWRSRSVYQLITDRFAPVNKGDPCDVAAGKYCGGNWRTIVGKLDYIQGMGYDAIWISPTGMNIEGSTPYGEAFHGFWVTDPTSVNGHFGSAVDLKALSNALHERGMYLMVDVAINALASTQNDLSDSALASAEGGNLLFKHRDNYHQECNIDWGNGTSEEVCWLGNDKVYLMDLNQDNDQVRNTLLNWAPKYVAEYGIDGFRIDATKHMTRAWQHDFCAAAGVYCIGEAYNDDRAGAGKYQGEGGIDGVLGFDMRAALLSVFGNDSPKPISAIGDALGRSNEYPDPTLVGAFLDNHDFPRFDSLVTDRTKGYNAIVANFLTRGLPTVYYGLEQDMSEGRNDPYNREALWLYGNFATDGETYQRIKKLNAVRAALGKQEGWYNLVAEQLETEGDDIALKRGPAVIVLTARGNGASGSWKVRKAGFQGGARVIDLLSCETVTADSDGAVPVTFTSGQPFVFVDEQTAASGGLCDLGPGNATTPSASSGGAGGNLIVTTSASSAGSTATGDSGSGSSGNTCNTQSSSRWRPDTVSTADGQDALTTGKNSRSATRGRRPSRSACRRRRTTWSACTGRKRSPAQRRSRRTTSRNKHTRPSRSASTRSGQPTASSSVWGWSSRSRRSRA